jgi:prepilin-type N-terminal cleavage/methylation domain-containing protein/prepilin-type processing-associated H-X9-DG protein
MVPSRRRGFTLIELLVVIAIIGILAAMLFPVFARARESARKIQCLANVKNIAIAFQMYLGDWDRLPPRESDPAALAYLGQAAGRCGCGDFQGDGCKYASYANPYLTFPVLLDEYTKNRDIWRCPSATVMSGAAFVISDPNWLRYMQQHEGEWGVVAGWMGPCSTSWPKGWGGAITDSCVQGKLADSTTEGAFVQGIGVCLNYGLSTAAVPDPSGWVVCADAGVLMELWSPVLTAFPEQCHLVCSDCSADWENCSWTRDCGAPLQGLTDPSFRKQWTRHLGGSNLGFMDGHAAWMAAERILDEAGTPLKPGKIVIQGWDSKGNGGVYPASDCIEASGRDVIGIR